MVLAIVDMAFTTAYPRDGAQQANDVKVGAGTDWWWEERIKVAIWLFARPALSAFISGSNVGRHDAVWPPKLW